MRTEKLPTEEKLLTWMIAIIFEGGNSSRLSAPSAIQKANYGKDTSPAEEALTKSCVFLEELLKVDHPDSQSVLQHLKATEEFPSLEAEVLYCAVMAKILGEKRHKALEQVCWQFYAAASLPVDRIEADVFALRNKQSAAPESEFVSSSIRRSLRLTALSAGFLGRLLEWRIKKGFQDGNSTPEAQKFI